MNNVEKLRKIYLSYQKNTRLFKEYQQRLRECENPFLSVSIMGKALKYYERSINNVISFTALVEKHFPFITNEEELITFLKQQEDELQN